jgi:hypothetical protein
VFPAVLAPHTLAFDRFRIEREAGRGGMGAVYLAHDLVRDERVALKVLLSEAEGIDRFVRESQTLASLGHPGIVRYIDHGRAPFGPAWLAMEWLEGESLSERLRRGPIGVEEAVRIARDAAEALGAAHAAGVVHRDIKPGNIFLARAGEGAPRVKVLDFGIARASKADLRSLTTTGTVLGTPYYMAPEQARSLRGIDARADVWSLGAVLYEMLGQRRPFEHESVVAVLAAVLLEEPPPLRELCPEAGESLTELVTRCLTKDPDGRPAHGAELVTLLDALDASQRTTLPLGGFPLGGARASRGLTEREQRVVFLVLALHAASGSDATVSDAGWSQSAAAQSPEGALRSIAEAHGARVESLTDGALVAILPDQGAPADQAARAARLALAMHQAVPARGARGRRREGRGGPPPSGGGRGAAGQRAGDARTRGCGERGPAGRSGRELPRHALRPRPRWQRRPPPRRRTRDRHRLQGEARVPADRPRAGGPARSWISRTKRTRSPSRGWRWSSARPASASRAS